MLAGSNSGVIISDEQLVLNQMLVFTSHVYDQKSEELDEEREITYSGVKL